MNNERCPKCGLSTIERYPDDKSLARCLNRGCSYKEKIGDRVHCVVCFGEVVEDTHEEYVGLVLDGGDNRKVKVSDGFYCKDCGIKYQFKPSEDMLREIMRGKK